jgi:toxin-antitoxin system PIN domain toxin
LIAVDTNILVYSHREDSAFHDTAYAAIAQLAEGRSNWAIPWPCVHEFLAIVTHPRIYDPPSPLARAVEQVDAWMESPSLCLIGESTAHWQSIRPLLTSARTQGAAVHDARVAALCLQHGCRELWTADRDFSRYPPLRTRNPLAASGGT